MRQHSPKVDHSFGNIVEGILLVSYIALQEGYNVLRKFASEMRRYKAL